jgi:hypothetical protein
MELLLAHGAVASLRNHKNMTALDMALQFERTAAAHVLQQHSS